MPRAETEAAWAACDFSGSFELAGADYGGGTDELPNLFEAVVVGPGIYYIACGVAGHCDDNDENVDNEKQDTKERRQGNSCHPT